jgi:hypothetical protein
VRAFLFFLLSKKEASVYKVGSAEEMRFLPNYLNFSPFLLGVKLRYFFFQKYSHAAGKASSFFTHACDISQNALE